MSTKRKRHNDYDSRITQRSVELFQLGQQMLAEGCAPDSNEMNEVALSLHRNLGLRPWQPDVFDFEFFDMRAETYPPHADFRLVEELHRRLVEAA
jgi:hypothetical protein